MSSGITNGYIVIIEWDGKIPPTPYYHRLRKITGGVRGDGNKETGVITRRSLVEDEDARGIILQEGAIITPSKSLARTVAATAKRYGAVDIHVGEVSLQTFTDLEDSDRDAMERIDTAYGRRGRPQKPISWIVTCIEDMVSMYVDEAVYVANCPLCGGFSIVTYPSSNPINFTYQVEKGGERSLFNEWLVTRFGSGKFILPFVAPRGWTADQKARVTDHVDPVQESEIKTLGKCVTTVNIKDDADTEIVDMLRDSKLVAHLSSIIGVDNALEGEGMTALDGIFAGRRYFSDADRSSARIKSIMEIMAEGYKSYISMSGDPDSVDVLDASVVFKPSRMRAMFHALEA